MKISIQSESKPMRDGASGSQTRRNDGFSLVGMAITMAIIGIITAMAVPNISRTLQLRRLDTASSLIASKLTDARINAIKRNRRTWLAINHTARTVQVQTRNDANTADINIGTVGTLPEGVTFSIPDTTAANAVRINFSSLGRLLTTDTTLPAPADVNAVTLRVNGANRMKTVTVGSAGQVTLGQMLTTVAVTFCNLGHPNCGTTH